ncbi:hypothetical protein BUE76_17410 [Cnuella takakiae]|nr:hypothetical protein BUE76_17410 [Cnuella takakiae]
MTVPVIRNLLHQYPHLEVTMVSPAFHAPLFAGMERLHFVAADLKGKHKGVAGLFRLFRQLRSNASFDAVADLHHVLRTRILRIFFSATRTRWASVDKGRAEKQALTRSQNKVLAPLKATFQRYADVFAQLGLPIQLDIPGGIAPKGQMPPILKLLKQEGRKAIGIAPFAQYSRKTYPPEKMLEVLRLLSGHPMLSIYLLGGKADVPHLKAWAEPFPNVEVVAGTLKFADELPFIAHLDVVVSMDSANMHLASLYGVPVVSIWGATHPYAGFYGWGQQAANAVQIDLACRPCSVFGNKPGPRADLACMHGISPLQVYQQVLQVLDPQ